MQDLWQGGGQGKGKGMENNGNDDRLQPTPFVLPLQKVKIQIVETCPVQVFSS